MVKRSSKRGTKQEELDSPEAIEVEEEKDTKYSASTFKSINKKTIKALDDRALNDKFNKINEMMPKDENAKFQKENTLDIINIEIKERQKSKEEKGKKKPTKSVTVAEQRQKDIQKKLTESLPPEMLEEVKKQKEKNAKRGEKSEKGKLIIDTNVNEDLGKVTKVNSKRGRQMIAAQATGLTFVFSDLLESIGRNTDMLNLDGLTDDYKEQKDDIEELWGEIADEHPDLINKFLGPKTCLASILSTTAISRGVANNKDKLGDLAIKGIDKYKEGKQLLIERLSQHRHEMSEEEIAAVEDVIENRPEDIEEVRKKKQQYLAQVIEKNKAQNKKQD